MRATILNRIVLVAAIVAVSFVTMNIRTNAQEQPQPDQKAHRILDGILSGILILSAIH
jgi:hypothetical protein